MREHSPNSAPSLGYAVLAAVNPANPQTWNEYAYVANQPLSATDPLGLFAPPGGIGPGPCDPNEIGWDWPAPGCSGWPPWPPILYPVFGGGGSGGVVVSGGGTVTAAPGPCTAPLCSAGAADASAAAGNAFLGFHLACEQAILLPSSASPIACQLFFLGIRLGSAGLTGLLGVTPIAVAFSGTLPIPAFPAVGAGVEVQYAVAPAQGFQCLGLGPAVAFPPVFKAINGGPLIFGNLPNARSILSGWGSSISVQPTPFLGAQAIWSGAGTLGGPTVGTPGISAAETWSKCSPL